MPKQVTFAIPISWKKIAIMFKFILKVPTSCGIKEWPGGGGEEVDSSRRRCQWANWVWIHPTPLLSHWHLGLLVSISSLPPPGHFLMPHEVGTFKMNLNVMVSYFQLIGIAKNTRILWLNLKTSAKTKRVGTFRIPECQKRVQKSRECYL